MLSPVDCVDVYSMVAQDFSTPANATTMRVQDMGDPGTPELAGEIANPVTWDVGRFSGFEAPPEAQRGYRDVVGTSAFQLKCSEAGFFINTATFSHAVALQGEGPNVSLGRALDPPAPAFHDSTALVIEANVRAPWVQSQGVPVGEGTAQLGLSIYFQDRTSGVVVAVTMGLFDNRPAGVNGSGVEGWGNDTHIAFSSSPLAAFDALGRPVRFVTVGASSAQMQYVQPWPESRHFVAIVTPTNMAAALATLKEQVPSLSPRPTDYVVLSFGFGGEVIAGTGNEHNVSFGASVSDLVLREIPATSVGAPS